MLPLSLDPDEIDDTSASQKLVKFLNDYTTKFANDLDTYFKVTSRGSNIAVELRAGLTTFLTMSYILLVNPQVLSLTGIPAEDIVISTAIAAGLASLISAIGSNLPFGLASGIGLSIYLTYGLIAGGSCSLKDAMTRFITLLFS